MLNNLSELIDKLKQVKSVESFEIIFQDICNICDLEYYLFASVKASSLIAPDIFVLSNYPSAWYKEYFSTDLKKYDPVVRYCFENSSPVIWSTLEKNTKYCCPLGLKLMQNSRDGGLIDGLTVPIKAHSGEIFIFSLSTGREDEIPKRLMNALPNALYFASTAVETYFRMNLGDSEMKPLTPKEKEALFWACEGKTAWEISKIMGITERTVNFHMSSVTEKLCAVNRQHAVAKATFNGLVKPNT
ncbi:LuxR family transcriptional regulator [Thalassotalea sp. 1_MG-2023]|uniref:helix-turn-helix transcriptional regulator n=1 Tax=Thalassotalea sp. 1_MG-2023 TaxID=3062680 RepID=UPI0026E460B2|nr:LuxR family transcriptional regulator [Thalassotalea sp. 1_MG-2023]MDO6428505.1 LuxR family transcriptional regulator [Thalassotalea sp. 1_MG-2023]